MQFKKLRIFILLFIILLSNEALLAQTFNQTQRLVSTNRAQSGRFGAALDLEGDILVIGSPGDQTDINGDSTIDASGAAYIYERTNNGSWVETQKIVSPNRNFLANFGISVSISGNLLAVGSWDSYDINGNNYQITAGAVYMYEKNLSTNQWSFVQKLVASDRNSSDRFAVVSLDGNHLLVGAPQNNVDANGANYLNHSGAVYAFERNPATGIWTETQKLVAPHRHVNDRFGEVLVTKGNQGFITAPYNDHNPNNTFFGTDAGLAYRIERQSNGTWTIINGFRANSAGPGDRFGTSIDFNNDIVVVGAPGREVTQSSQVYSDAGALHILDNIPSLPDIATVSNPNPNFNDRMGISVAIGLGRIFVGSPEDEQIYSVIESSPNTWVTDESFYSSFFSTLGNFASSIAIDDQVMVVGAPGDRRGMQATDTIIASSGSVDVFENCLATRDTIMLSRCNDPYTGPSGQYTWASTGIYQDTITNYRGCDSIVEIDLTYSIVDTSVTINGILMTANTVVGTYQWYDCDNQQIIAGATNRSFNAPSNGTYALITSLNGCTDTSACFFINVVGLNDPIAERNVQVYPNPTTGLLLLDWKEVQEFVHLSIINPTGQVVQERFVKGQAQAQLNLNELASGWYFIRLQADGQAPLTVRVRKQ